MRIIPLLAQYLYAHKRLDLPGIGSFILDPQAITEPENNKRPQLLTHIRFENNPLITAPDPELVSFISLHSGKMKALAASDLESHIQLALQFLNTGKPFLFEGIGTLISTKPGEYAFSPGWLLSARHKEPPAREPRKAEKEKDTEAPGTAYEPFLPEKKSRPSFQRPLIGLVLLAGLGLAIYAGYYISQRKSNTAEQPAETNRTEPAPADSLSLLAGEKPSIRAAQNPVAVDSYKYVLEIADSKRAFERYGKLRSYQWQVQMETNDSVQYKLFLHLPSSLSDTTRIMDSLTVLNGRRVFIDYQN